MSDWCELVKSMDCEYKGQATLHKQTYLRISQHRVTNVISSEQFVTSRGYNLSPVADIETHCNKILKTQLIQQWLIEAEKV